TPPAKRPSSPGSAGVSPTRASKRKTGTTIAGKGRGSNPDQQRAIETLDGLCVVMAGPGTGKTDTLTAKTAAILTHGGRPLAVTYTREPAQELTRRLGPLQEQVTACTCHSLAFNLFSRLTVAPHSCPL